MSHAIAAEPRDLNRNGRIDVYEDRSAPIADRIEDLLGQMTVAEKVGLMFHTMTFFNAPFPLPDPMNLGAVLAVTEQIIDEIEAMEPGAYRIFTGLL